MKWRSGVVFGICAMLALAPSFAEARAGGAYRSGGGSSFSSQGSRGSQTYQSNGGGARERSLTPRQQPSSPSAPAYGGGIGGFASQHPFLTGMFGGLAGSWIGSMLFPHWGGMGGGYGGGGGMLGSIFTWLIIIGGAWFIYRMFAGRRTATAPYESTGMGFGGGSPTPLFGGSGGGYAAPQPARISVQATDYQQFEEVLQGVQGAWTKADLTAMRRYATPEMLSYFSEQLSENESQGVSNHVENVELIKGDVREAWDEGRMQYATALMQWRARDYTVRNDGHAGEAQMIVNGDPQRQVEVSELWTFARSPDGRWLLSAIQQI